MRNSFFKRKNCLLNKMLASLMQSLVVVLYSIVDIHLRVINMGMFEKTTQEQFLSYRKKHNGRLDDVVKNREITWSEHSNPKEEDINFYNERLRLLQGDSVKFGLKMPDNVSTSAKHLTPGVQLIFYKEQHKVFCGNAANNIQNSTLPIEQKIILFNDLKKHASDGLGKIIDAELKNLKDPVQSVGIELESIRKEKDKLDADCKTLGVHMDNGTGPAASELKSAVPDALYELMLRQQALDARISAVQTKIETEISYASTPKKWFGKQENSKVLLKSVANVLQEQVSQVSAVSHVKQLDNKLHGNANPTLSGSYKQALQTVGLTKEQHEKSRETMFELSNPDSGQLKEKPKVAKVDEFQQAEADLKSGKLRLKEEDPAAGSDSSFKMK